MVTHASFCRGWASSREKGREGAWSRQERAELAAASAFASASRGRGVEGGDCCCSLDVLGSLRRV